MGENEEEPVTEKSRARTFQAEGRVRVKAGRGEQTWWLLEQGGGPCSLVNKLGVEEVRWMVSLSIWGCCNKIPSNHRLSDL